MNRKGIFPITIFLALILSLSAIIKYQPILANYTITSMELIATFYRFKCVFGSIKRNLPVLIDNKIIPIFILITVLVAIIYRFSQTYRRVNIGISQEYKFIFIISVCLVASLYGFI